MATVHLMGIFEEVHRSTLHPIVLNPLSQYDSNFTNVMDNRPVILTGSFSDPMLGKCTFAVKMSQWYSSSDLRRETLFNAVYGMSASKSQSMHPWYMFFKFLPSARTYDGGVNTTIINALVSHDHISKGRVTYMNLDDKLVTFIIEHNIPWAKVNVDTSFSMAHSMGRSGHTVAISEEHSILFKTLT